MPDLIKKNIEHVGDGVYVESDGFALRIRVNDHRNDVAVTLEPFVMERLIGYYNSVKPQKP